MRSGQVGSRRRRGSRRWFAPTLVAVWSLSDSRTCALVPTAPRTAADLPALNEWLGTTLLSFDKVQVQACPARDADKTSSGQQKQTTNWGLFAQKRLRRGDVALEVPSGACVTAASARDTKRKNGFADLLRRAEEAAGEAWEPLCGDVSLIAAQVPFLPDPWRRVCCDAPGHFPLTLFSTTDEKDDDADDDDAEKKLLLSAYSSRAFGALAANARDDYAWLSKYGAFDGSFDEYLECVVAALSRSFPVDGRLALAPGIDFVNHDDLGDEDALARCLVSRRVVSFSGKGDPTKIVLTCPENLEPGDELRMSYGPLPVAAYAETYGFAPSRGVARRASSACELRFDLNVEDRFLDDKREILREHENDDLAGVLVFSDDDDDAPDGVQVCVGAGAAALGEQQKDAASAYVAPVDPEYMRFARLNALGGPDAFLLEPLFSKEIWGFLALPVSEDNERAALAALADECRAVKAVLQAGGSSQRTDDDDDDPEKRQVRALLERVREVEIAALDATLDWVDVELASLSTKEYYQERRLKDLGLDTEWCAEDAQWSGSRVPGGVDW